MSHEPGRERHMQYRCEHCGTASSFELEYNEHADEYWCVTCLDNEAEAAYERQLEKDLESPPESAREEQIRTWEEKQKLKGR